MQFVCMDLVGEFHPPSSKDNRYALNAVCMLTGYTFCIPTKNKSVEEIMTAWRNHIAFPFGVCRNCSQTMEQNLKMIYFLGLQKALRWKKNLLTSMQTAIKWMHWRISQIPKNIFLGIENGMMPYPLLQLHTTGYQTSTLRITILCHVW